MTTLLFILAITLATSFLCSILEAVFLSVTHSHIALLKNRGEWAGAWLEHAQKNVEDPIAAILTLNTIANTMGATLGGAAAAKVFGDPWVAAFSAAMTLTVLLFSEIVPKTIGATYWKHLAKPAAYVLSAMITAMKPLLIPLSWVSGLITPSEAPPTVSRAELEVLAEIGRREGTLDDSEFSVMSAVIRLDEITVGEVMTPRTDMVGIPSTASIAEAQTIMLDTGHLRLPVYRDNLDTITGVVLGRDIWRAHRDGIDDLAAVLRPVPFAPSSKRIEDLIPEMRSQLTKMAIVIDEFGGTAGLVTLEDLIEEIIGEIQDEHEGDEPVSFETLPAGVRVWGGTSLREASQKLGFIPTEDEEEGFDTLGGFVFGRLNRIPVVGDEVAVGPGHLRVTQMTGRRIDYLLFIGLK
ncbi:MAG: hemolysin family protein [Gemmatimonadetes bacterium]|nr:hemolysin family protein [Gemmatimonadota bacterium]MDA1103207.1 hemolysin family protein [Gemmatimonadota bacterium]